MRIRVVVVTMFVCCRRAEVRAGILRKCCSFARARCCVSHSSHCVLHNEQSAVFLFCCQGTVCTLQAGDAATKIYRGAHFEGMFIKKGSRIFFFRIEELKAKELPTLSALERQSGATSTVTDRESNDRSDIDHWRNFSSRTGR